MPKILVIEGEIEISQELLGELLPIAREVAAGRLPVMEEKTVAGCRVDVGGRGVGYGVIRVRTDAEVFRMTPTLVGKFVAGHEPLSETTGTMPAPGLSEKMPSLPPPIELHRDAPRHHAAWPKPPLPPSPAPPLKTDEIIVQLSSLLEGTGLVVNDHEVQKVKDFIEQYRQHGAQPALEQAFAEMLKSPQAPTFLKARLVQHLVRLAIPELSASVAAALKDPQLRAYFRDRKLDPLLQKLQQALNR